MYKSTTFVEQAAAPTLGVLVFCATTKAVEASQDARQVLATVMVRTQAFAGDVKLGMFRQEGTLWSLWQRYSTISKVLTAIPQSPFDKFADPDSKSLSLHQVHVP